MALQPNTRYIMRLYDSPSTRNLVQIFDGNGTKLLTQFFAIPDERSTPSDKTTFTFIETAAGYPMPIKEWFYPGRTTGLEFIYPQKQATKIAKHAKEPLLNPKSVDLHRIAALTVEAGSLAAAVQTEVQTSVPAENVAKTAAENVVKAVTENVVITTAENVAKAAAEDVSKAAPENVAKAVTENVAKAVTENVAKAAAESVAKAAAENVAKAAAADVAEAAAEDVETAVLPPDDQADATTAPQTASPSIPGTILRVLPAVASKWPLIGLLGTVVVGSGLGMIAVYRRRKSRATLPTGQKVSFPARVPTPVPAPMSASMLQNQQRINVPTQTFSRRSIRHSV
jgi:hypothetical protein